MYSKRINEVVMESEQKTRISIKAKTFAGISVFLFFIGALLFDNMKMSNPICVSWLVWIGALLCGIISFWKMKNIEGFSAARLLVLIYCIFIIILALGIPCVVSDGYVMDRYTCSVNLKVLDKAIRIYCQKHNGEFPDPSKWCDLIINEPNNKFVDRNYNPNYLSIFCIERFYCLTGGRSKSGYAFNYKLTGKRISEIDPNVVILFETANSGLNQYGSSELIYYKKHKSLLGESGSTVLCVGKDKPIIKFVPQSEVKNLRWNP